LLFIAYNTILVACHIRTVTLKITGFPTIIIYRVRAVSFKITSLTTAVIKLRSFLKRTISVYMASRKIEIVF
jgi:lipid A disaccharide synthetase